MADWRAEARQAAQRHGINPTIFERQIGTESNFNPAARSPAGATGIAQFMPGTAAGLGINPNDPHQALDAAAKLMSGYIKKYGGWQGALAAYNGGPGVVGRALPRETRAYISKILGGTNPSAQVNGPKVGSAATSTTTVGPATTKTDTSGAIVDSMLAQQPLSQRKLGGGGLLAAAQGRIDSGAYTTTTPGKTTTTTTPGKASAAKVAQAAAPHGKGVANFEGHEVAAWIAPILQYAREQGWKGQVNSGVRSLAEQTRIYNSGVRPAAKPGTSNHEMTAFPGGAIDVSEAEHLSQILKGTKYQSLLVWAGSKDPVHFSHPHNGSY